MFDIGWPEIVVVLIVALLVIGPRDLPKAFHTVGKWVRAARRVTSDFQRHVDDMMRETELEDLRKVANQARNLNVKKQIENVIDPSGDLKGTFDVNSPSPAKPEALKPTPDIPASPGPGVPVGAKAEATATGDAATKSSPATKHSSTARKAPAKTAAKSAAKTSPRMASRVPKKRTSRDSGAGKGAAGKASTSESTS